MRGILCLAALAVCSGCAATIREEAGRAQARLPAASAGRLLARAWSQLDGGKRIFDIRLTDRTRVLNGAGAISYAKDPLRLRLDVFGPHATPVFSLAQAGDSMTIRLYEERRFVAGPVGDPAFAQLAEGRSFTGPELLGALLGAYDPSALIAGPADTLAYAAGDEWVVALLQEGRAHRFAYSAADSTLREYRQEREGSVAYRARFSEYRAAGDRLRPFRVELEDVGERRTLRAGIRSETFEPVLSDDGYRLEPF